MGDGQVYFLAARTVGLVKIGRSIDMVSRLQAIRWLSPVPLELIGLVEGGSQREAAYHRRWANLRSHGEWFNLTVELAIDIEAEVLMDAWNRACPEARQLAMEQIDAPVFDRTAARPATHGTDSVRAA